MIDHTGDCNAQPCTCGASIRAFLKRNPPTQGQVIQDTILADRLGIAGDEE